MRRSHPLLALVAVAAVAAGGVALDRVTPRMQPRAAAGTAPSGAWFCPHGGGPQWQVTLSVADPGAQPATIRVTTFSSSGSTAAKSFSIDAGATLQIPVRATDQAASSMVEWFGPWVAAGWVAHAGGAESGVAAEPCTSSAGATWYAADGDTGQNHSSYLIVMNPFAARANVTVTLFVPEGAPIVFGKFKGVEIPPAHAAAFHLNDARKGESALGIMLQAASGRVAVSTLDVATTGGVSSVIGSTATSERVFLPATGDGGASTLAVLDPGSAPGHFGATLRGRGVPSVAGDLTDQTQPAQSAATYPVTTSDPSSIDVVGEGGGPPLAAARRAQGPSIDAGATAGAVAPAPAWVVLPTVAGEPSTPGLVLENPGDVDAQVTLHLLAPAGATAPADVVVRVRAGEVAAAPAAFLAAAPLASVLVSSDGAPVVATGASSSTGQEGVAGYAIAVGVPVPPAT